MAQHVSRGDACQLWFSPVPVRGWLSFTSLLAWLITAAASCTAADALSPPQNASVKASNLLAKSITQTCIDCHSGEDAEARLDLEGMLENPLADNFPDWRGVLRVLRNGSMPPDGEADWTADHRAAISNELRTLFTRAAAQHARDPGPTQVRRLTSAEFDYCLEDLTGLQLGLGNQFVSDSVGGSGFTNSASAQFLQDAMLERYLEAAKSVADHAIIGAGPLHFYEASGQTGMELSAIGRIQSLYRRHGFRSSAGEGAKPYGLERFPQALVVAWKYRYREAFDAPTRSLDELAIEASLDPKFVRHLWNALNRSDAGFPLSEVIASWSELPSPRDVGPKRASELKTLEATVIQLCRDLFLEIQAWQERFAGAASAEEEAAVLTGGRIAIPSSRSFLVQARRRRLAPDDNFTPDLNNPRLYSQDGTVRLRITVEPASSPREPGPSVILRTPTFQFRYLEQVNPEPVPLLDAVTSDSKSKLGFGQNHGGEAIGMDEIAVHVGEEKIVAVVLPDGCNTGQLRFDAMLDSVLGRGSAVRLVVKDITDANAGKPTGRHYSSLLRDQTSHEMEQWESGLTEFAGTFPQISHREPAPSDRDPIPAPYDNTYNLPERNRFHTAVKYYREDAFLTKYLMPPNAIQALEEAWADLLLSFDYHDVNLRFVAEKYGIDLPTDSIANVKWNWIESLPAEPHRFIAGYKSEHDSMTSLMQAAERRHLDDVSRFAAKAWRRPLQESDEHDLRSFYRLRRKQDQLTHRQAIRSTIARILVSPEFLFRIEQAPPHPSDQPLSSLEVASRLSFSLWSSAPDEELLDLARQDALRDDDVLQQQVERMLASPNARRMATEFFGQWLGFYQFDRFRGVDQDRFPEFDNELRASLYQEAITFCEYIIRQDRPYHELIDADYAFVDPRTADHYGMLSPNEGSSGPQKISLTPDQPRGGVLGLGAILISTSAPLRTSPVKRGDWILRRLLGTPVPPPPADAGSIPADDILSDGKTVRERLELHRNQANCRGCHERIDPLGFALEHFDSLGRWRDTYRDGHPIDASGTLDSGDEVRGLAGLKSHLRDQDEDFRRTLASRLTAYMLGRPEAIADTALIQEVADRMASEPQFSTAVRTIVLSPQFRRIRGSARSDDASSTTHNGPTHASSTGANP